MTDHWKTALETHWGIAADLTALDGEFDLNFLANAANGAAYILKVMRPGCDLALIDMQVRAFDRLKAQAPELPFPAVIKARSGKSLVHHEDVDREPRILWLLERLPGRTYAKAAPKTNGLIADLGAVLGGSDKTLAGFDHPYLHRDFKWNLMGAGWIGDSLQVVDRADRRAVLTDALAAFRSIRNTLVDQPVQAIHNDANDYNILISGTLSEPRRVSGLIDLGDMCAAPRICNLAIAAAYVVLDHPRPEAALAELVAGYHSANPLEVAELDMLWPLLQMRLAVSVVNSTIMAAEKPDDPYVEISQAPAWRFLEGNSVEPALLNARLRIACGFPVTDAAPRVLAFLDRERGNFVELMGQNLADAPMGSLSVENSLWPRDPFDLPLAEASEIGSEFEDGGRIWLGYYLEPRLIYTAPGFRKGPWLASDRRTVHLAVDGFAPAGLAMHAPLAGRVHAVENRTAHLDYGGMVILSHETPDGDSFYTLYGHLNPDVCETLQPGQHIEKGAVFCRLGDPSQNGGWAPHVHFQVALTVDGIGDDWPGVGDPDEVELWQAICPNPAALLNLPDHKVRHVPTSRDAVLADRRAHFGDNLKLSYDEPVMLVRGWRHHLFDEWGRPYLDAYNNVPHVGHAHPRIRAVACDQLGRMNSNTRYLHPAQTAFAEKLLSKLPGGFDTCFLVNSGSEANELALRLSRAHTGARGMVTPDHGYHGNTTGAIDISAYKFNAKGGVGPSDWVELVEVADDYRGSFRREDPHRAEKFAGLVDDAIAALADRGQGLAGFIAETFPSVGGQIIPPVGYLAAVYRKIHAVGGLCIADEVQTGLGRLGTYYFGFEQQQVVPDIVVLGKPIGNGHPIGVVLTRREIAESFARGPEFFSTFGGSTLSCRIGKEVLDIVDDEGLQENARVQGDRLLAGLRVLQAKHAAIGDVRGIGLFVGVELIADPATRAEGTQIATYVKNRMRQERILLGTEGPKDNILKVRPPLTITAQDIDMILVTLDRVLDEL